MLSQDYFDPYLTQVISEERFLYDGLQNEEIVKRIKSLSNYLSKIKRFVDKDDVKKVIDTLTFLYENKNIFDQNNALFKGNTISIYCDLMRILMSEKALSEKIHVFFFNMIAYFIELFMQNVFSIEHEIEKKFEYIIDCLGKTNLLSILNDFKYDKTHKIVLNLLKIQRYSLIK